MKVLGPLWQGRYRARLVEDQRYLDRLLSYIHLNPVTAGLAEDPAEYLNKHPVAVTNWVMRGVRRRSEDLETAAGIEALDRKLCERSGGKD